MLRRRHVLALPLLSAWSTPARAAERPLIVLQPLGSAVPELALRAVSTAIAALFAVDLELATPLALPASAFYAKRRRYRAEKLLDYLVQHGRKDARVTLGLASVDISTTKPPHEDWGILGLATLDGRSAVLSSFRCGRQAKDAEHVRTRFAKTAVHELGHAFGLEHCPSPGCLMHDGEGSALTTDTEHDFCARTRQQLDDAGVLRPQASSPFVK